MQSDTVKVIMFSFNLNCFGEALIQLHDHCGGFSLWCYTDKCFYYFVHLIHISEGTLNDATFSAGLLLVTEYFLQCGIRTFTLVKCSEYQRQLLSDVYEDNVQ